MNVFLTVSLQQPTDYFGDLFHMETSIWDAKFSLELKGTKTKALRGIRTSSSSQ